MRGATLGTVVHGPLKEYSTAVARIKRDYLDRDSIDDHPRILKPECGALVDILRATVQHVLL